MSRSLSFGASKWPGVAKLVEECGEVVQVAGKLMNLPDCDQVDHWDGTNLRDEITNEIADVIAASTFVTQHCKLDAKAIAQRVADKLALFEKWHVEQAETTTSADHEQAQAEAPRPARRMPKGWCDDCSCVLCRCEQRA